MLTKIYKVLFFLLFLAVQQSALAQQRFYVGFILGGNLTQLDGDGAQGYDKLGLQAGTKILGRLQENIYLSTEILYTQKGSNFEFKKNGRTFKQSIDLNYISVPLIFTKRFRRIRVSPDHVYHRLSFSVGFAYSRLLNTEINETEDDDIDFTASSFFYNNNDFSMQLGGGIAVNKHLEFEARASISFNRIYDQREHPELLTGVVLLRNYYLMARIVYIL
ncbi:MAG: porin family protein [Bacteroidota bacterium]